MEGKMTPKEKALDLYSESTCLGVTMMDGENGFSAGWEARDTEIQSLINALIKIDSIEDWAGGTDLELVNEMAKVARHALAEWEKT